MGQSDQTGVRRDTAGPVPRHRGPGRSDLTPLIEPEPALGQVVVTRFECGTLSNLLALLILHWRVKRRVRRGARGLIGVRTVVDRRRRTLLSISLWQDLDSVYSMGNVPDHVGAARVPGSLGVRTASGVFCFVGDWRRVMFHSPSAPRSPLHPLPSDTIGKED